MGPDTRHPDCVAVRYPTAPTPSRHGPTPAGKDGDIVGRAIEAGATGYLLKDARTEDLLAAVPSTEAGETVLWPAVAGRLAAHVRDPGKSSASLTAREREVLALVARGRPNRAIARELFVSEATIKTHLVHIYDKLGATDRATAATRTYEQGLLE